MKSFSPLLLVIPAFVIGSACSQTGVTVGNDAATTGSGGSTTSGSGGATATGSGGAATTGSGGATNGSGGASVGSGGSSTGSGGSINPSGGANGTGSGGNNGSGGSIGTGGQTGSGGGGGGGKLGTGGTGLGGSTGSGGAQGGTTGTISVGDLAGIANTYGETLASSWFIVPCYKEDAQDCYTIPTTASCPAAGSTPFEMQGVTTTNTFKLGGTTGTNYKMTFTVNGITEAKYYEKGTRDAGNAAPADAESDAGTDTFYVGGNPVAQEHYNIYKLTVKTSTGTEVQHYYLNSFPNVAPTYENHRSFAIDYTKTIVVPGGGSVELFLGDSNCRAINNCGPGVYSGTCKAPRKVPSEPNLVVPTKYMGKNVSDLNLVNGATQPFHSQIVHITVTAVAPM